MFRRLLPSLIVFRFLAFPVLTQPQDKPQDNPPPQSPTAAVPSTTASGSDAPKRVWTNENLAGAKGPVSVVGDKRNQTYHLTSSHPADPATVARIKKDLQKLQSQLDDVNNKLKSYKQFQDGEPVSSGARDISKGYSRTPVDQQMIQLLDKKKQLEAQIGELIDEARAKGIDPGQLR
jgi:hypothetical protein